MKILLSVILSALSAFSTTPTAKNADIANNSQNDVASFASLDTKIEEEKVENFFTQLALELSSPETGKVAVTLTNTFTLFVSTVPVRLRLYSSLTKTSDISEMTLEGSAYSSDLDMNTSISVTSSTHGEDRYWVGYAIYYKSGEEVTYQVGPDFYYADGTDR